MRSTTSTSHMEKMRWISMRPMSGTQTIRVRTTIRIINKTEQKCPTPLTIHQVTITIPNKIIGHQVTITTATQDMDTTKPTNRRNRLMYLSHYMGRLARSNCTRFRRYYDIHHSTEIGSSQKITQ